MKTIRALSTEIIELLQTNAEKIGVAQTDIKSGKYNEGPTSTPSILVFIEPQRGSKFNYGIAKIEIFTCASNQNHIEAVLKSYELAERVSRILSSHRDVSGFSDIVFDNFYSNIAVTYLSTDAKFKFDELLEVEEEA